MNCDRIAPVYRFLEYGSFGSAMQSTRCRFLPECRDSRRVLLLGDGDGRFLARILKSNPEAVVDSIDNSREMLRQAARRVSRLGVGSRVCLHHLDVRRDPMPDRNYDLIVTNFFLDCFTGEELAVVLENVVAALADEAFWLISEFREPERGWRKWRAHAWIAALYKAFKLAANLEANRMPDYAPLLRSADFRLMHSHTRSGGMLISELWRRQRSDQKTIPLRKEKAG